MKRTIRFVALSVASWVALVAAFFVVIARLALAIGGLHPLRG